MVKIGCLIITYNPDLQRLEDNLINCTQQISNVVIVDNGSKNISSVQNMCRMFNSHLISLNKNIGIAGAQNRGFHYLQGQGYNWVLTLDQDSIIPLNMIEAFIKSQKLKNDTGIITPAYTDENWNGKKKLNKQANNIVITRKNLVISSGNLVNVKAWETVDGFDEDLFIDLVDFDFDAKLNIAGYKIFQLDNIYLRHSIGIKIKKSPIIKFILLCDAAISDHSAARQYYIYRNSIIFHKRYAAYKKRFLIVRTLIATRRILLYRNRREKFLSAIKGINDGMRYSTNRDVKFQKTLAKLERRERNY